MRRRLRFKVDVFSPYQPGDPMCVEMFTQLGDATPNRILHFGISEPLDDVDVEFIGSRIQEVIEGTIIRVIGVHTELEL